MEDLPLGRIAALVPEFAVKDLPLGRTHDDDIYIYIYIYIHIHTCMHASQIVDNFFYFRIIAVNYEARDFGVTRNMRGDEAKKKCPDIELVHVPCLRGKADLTKYRDAGREVVDVLCQFSDCVQKASVDEAYIDITNTVDNRMKHLSEIQPSQLASTFVVGFCDSSNDEGEFA